MRIIFFCAATALGLLIAAPAFPQTDGAPERRTETVTVYDSSVLLFATEREVVDAVKQVYGENVVYSNGADLSDEIDAQIRPGNPLPEDAPTEAVDPELGRLIADKLPDGARWVEVGPHLVAVDRTDTIMMAVYDVVE